MDLNKLTLADKIILGSGIVLFIAYFLTWFTVEFDGDFGFGGSADAKGSDVDFLWSTLPDADRPAPRGAGGGQQARST